MVAVKITRSEYGTSTQCKSHTCSLDTRASYAALTSTRTCYILGHLITRCLNIDYIHHERLPALLACTRCNQVKGWDLRTNDCSTLFGHTSFVRAVAVDELGHTLYSGSDDRKIKIWQAR